MLALGASIVTPDVRKQMEDRLEKDEKIQQMLQRTPMIKKSLHSVDTSDDWTLGANMFGILTHYKKCEDDPTSIIVKIEGTLDDLPLFEQMAVIHEIDLFKEWAPFCTNSVLVDKIGKAELFGYVVVRNFIVAPVYRKLTLMTIVMGTIVFPHAGMCALACPSSAETFSCTHLGRTAWRSTEKWSF